jgi:hypothetical protein
VQEYISTIQSLTKEEAQAFGVMLLPVMAQALVPVYNLPELAAANNTLVPPPFPPLWRFPHSVCACALTGWAGGVSRCWMG